LKKKSLFCFFTILVFGISGILAVTEQNYLYDIDSYVKTHSLPSELTFCGIFPLETSRGSERRDSFLMAIDEINTQSGFNRILPSDVTIKPLFIDDQDSPSGGKLAANYCVENNASIVIGSSKSSSSIAIAEVLTPHEIIQISYASSFRGLSNRTKYPFFMRVENSDNDVVKVINDLAEDFQWTKGSILTDIDILNQDIANEIQSGFNGIIQEKIIFFPQNYTMSDINPLKSTTSEFIVIIDNSNLETLFTMANELQLMNNPNIAWIVINYEEFFPDFIGNDALNDLIQNIIQITPVTFKGPNYQEFVDQWLQTNVCGLTLENGPVSPCAYATGAIPNPYSAPAYDSVFIAAKGFATVSKANPNFTDNNASELLSYLYDVNHVGVGAEYHFNDLGEIEGPYSLYSLSGNTYNLIAEWKGDLKYKTSSITLPGDSSWIITNNELTCFSNCPDYIGRTNSFFPELVISVFLLLTVIIIVFLYIRKSKNKNFSNWIETTQMSKLQQLYRKIIIGLDRVQIHLLKNTDSMHFNKNLITQSGSSVGVINLFPPEFKNELKSTIRGRTVLVLIELAYQKLEQSHTSFIAVNLKLPFSTVASEIRVLTSLGYIENIISKETLSDARFKFYSLTEKGVLFLYLMKESITLTLTQIDDEF
jgi:hypothetical protein